jgi:pimeloyl-[acyl-carrier protein] methyl ester esterase
MSAQIATGGLYSECAGGSDAAVPLVLLHGWGLNLRVFDGLRAALGPEQRIVAIDLPGHGASPWTGQTSAQQWLASIGGLVPRGATLLGWSLGGQLALQLASQPSLAVRRLVLIATSARFVRADDWPHGMAAATLQQFAAQLERDPQQTVAEFLELQVRGSLDAAAVRANLQHALLQHGTARPEALRAALALLEHNDLRPLARGINIPALVVTGQHDRVTPPQAGQALAQLLPHGQLLQIPRAGHAPFLSHLPQVSAALLEFLRDDARVRPNAERRATS